MEQIPACAFTHNIPALRLGEFDMGGVLYHANYFHLYEMAREALLSAAGQPYPRLVANGRHLAIAEAHQQFLKPVLYGKSLAVILWVSDLGASSFVFNYVISNSEDPSNILHVAWTRMAFVEKGLESFKIARLDMPLKTALIKHALTPQ